MLLNINLENNCFIDFKINFLKDKKKTFKLYSKLNYDYYYIINNDSSFINKQFVLV